MSYAEDTLRKIAQSKQSKPAHGRDGTLLQRMGFQDEDRGAQHDEITAWAANPKAAKRILFAAGEDPVDVTRVRLEAPIQKGHDQYATTVGFADLVISANFEGRFDDGKKCLFNQDYLVEVKTKIQGIGDLLRQMNIYREYAQNIKSFIVLSWSDQDEQYTQLLQGQGILLVVRNRV